MPDAGYVKLFPGSQQLGVSIPAENLLYQISYDSAQLELPFNAPDHIHFVWNMQLHSESEKHYQQLGLCALLAGPQPKPHSPHGLPKAW